MVRALDNVGKGKGRGDVVIAFLCAFVLVLTQSLTLAHASSHEAAAPGHDPKTCVYHVNGDRPAAALAPEAPLLTTPLWIDADGYFRRDDAAAPDCVAGVRARGPPLDD